MTVESRVGGETKELSRYLSVYITDTGGGIYTATITGLRFDGAVVTPPLRLEGLRFTSATDF